MNYTSNYDLNKTSLLYGYPQTTDKILEKKIDKSTLNAEEVKSPPQAVLAEKKQELTESVSVKLAGKLDELDLVKNLKSSPEHGEAVLKIQSEMAGAITGNLLDDSLVKKEISSIKASADNFLNKIDHVVDKEVNRKSSEVLKQSDGAGGKNNIPDLAVSAKKEILDKPVEIKISDLAGTAKKELLEKPLEIKPSESLKKELLEKPLEIKPSESLKKELLEKPLEIKPSELLKKELLEKPLEIKPSESLKKELLEKPLEIKPLESLKKEFLEKPLEIKPLESLKKEFLEKPLEIKPSEIGVPSKKELLEKPLEIKPSEIGVPSKKELLEKPLEIKPSEIGVATKKELLEKPLEIKPSEIGVATKKELLEKPLELKPLEIGVATKKELLEKPLEIKPSEIGVAIKKELLEKPLEIKPSEIVVATKKELLEKPLELKFSDPAGSLKKEILDNLKPVSKQSLSGEIKKNLETGKNESITKPFISGKLFPDEPEPVPAKAELIAKSKERINLLTASVLPVKHGPYKEFIDKKTDSFLKPSGKENTVLKSDPERARIPASPSILDPRRIRTSSSSRRKSSAGNGNEQHVSPAGKIGRASGFAPVEAIKDVLQESSRTSIREYQFHRPVPMNNQQEKGYVLTGEQNKSFKEEISSGNQLSARSEEGGTGLASTETSVEKYIGSSVYQHKDEQIEEKQFERKEVLLEKEISEKNKSGKSDEEKVSEKNKSGKGDEEKVSEKEISEKNKPVKVEEEKISDKNKSVKSEEEKVPEKEISDKNKSVKSEEEKISDKEEKVKSGEEKKLTGSENKEKKDISDKKEETKKLEEDKKQEKQAGESKEIRKEKIEKTRTEKKGEEIKQDQSALRGEENKEKYDKKVKNEQEEKRLEKYKQEEIKVDKSSAKTTEDKEKNYEENRDGSHGDNRHDDREDGRENGRKREQERQNDEEEDEEINIDSDSNSIFEKDFLIDRNIRFSSSVIDKIYSSENRDEGEIKSINICKDGTQMLKITKSIPATDRTIKLTDTKNKIQGFLRDFTEEAFLSRALHFKPDYILKNGFNIKSISCPDIFKNFYEERRRLPKEPAQEMYFLKGEERKVERIYKNGMIESVTNLPDYKKRVLSDLSNSFKYTHVIYRKHCEQKILTYEDGLSVEDAVNYKTEERIFKLRQPDEFLLTHRIYYKDNNRITMNEVKYDNGNVKVLLTDNEKTLIYNFNKAGGREYKEQIFKDNRVNLTWAKYGVREASFTLYPSGEGRRTLVDNKGNSKELSWTPSGEVLYMKETSSDGKVNRVYRYKNGVVRKISSYPDESSVDTIKYPDNTIKKIYNFPDKTGEIITLFPGQEKRRTVRYADGSMLYEMKYRDKSVKRGRLFPDGTVSLTKKWANYAGEKAVCYPYKGMGMVVTEGPEGYKLIKTIHSDGSCEISRDGDEKKVFLPPDIYRNIMKKHPLYSMINSPVSHLKLMKNPFYNLLLDGEIWINAMLGISVPFIKPVREVADKDKSSDNLYIRVNFSFGITPDRRNL